MIPFSNKLTFYLEKIIKQIIMFYIRVIAACLTGMYVILSIVPGQHKLLYTLMFGLTDKIIKWQDFCLRYRKPS